MSKRHAGSELNHDNWDVEEEDEDPGTFVPLKSSELKDRVIKKAKRSLNKESSSVASSPFSSFSGFKASTTSSPFSFLPKKSNGDCLGEQTKTFLAKDSETKSGQSSNTTSQDSVSKMQNSTSSRSMEYFRRLQNLNKSVLEWMKLHIEKNPVSDFTPVFNDYKKYMDLLNVTYPIKVNDTATAVDLKSSECFKKPADISNSSNNNSKDKKQSSEKDNYGAHFASNTTNTSTFSFGIKSTPTATSTGSPCGPASSSKEELIKEAAPASQFSFGYFKQNASADDKPFSFAVAAPVANKTDSESKDEEYVPPKNEFVAVQEEGAIFSKKCKLFFKKDGAFTEKGVGTLFLKSLENKTQLLIRADTSLGNILLNIMLTSSLPTSRTGKNNVLIVCIPNPPINAKEPDSKEAIPILIRVKTAEDADELLEILNKHKL